MTIVDVQIAAEELEELIDRARSGEQIVIRDGESMVLIEPIFHDDSEA